MAIFTVSPRVGDSTTVFYFDARPTYDERNYALSLRVRWDWDADGTWDTGFSQQKEQTRRFPGSGYRNVRMQVIDQDGQTAEASDSIYLFEQNVERDSMTDPRDGHIYPVIRMNGKWVMTTNLLFGTWIDDSQFAADNGISEYYLYNNKVKNQTYGGLYPWIEAMDYNYWSSNRGVCPPGWHIPAKEEWLQLFYNFPERRVDMQYYFGPSSFSGFNLEYLGGMWKAPDGSDLLYTVNEVGYWCSDYPEIHENARGHKFYDVFVARFDQWDRGMMLIDYKAVYPSYTYPPEIQSYYVRCMKDE